MDQAHELAKLQEVMDVLTHLEVKFMIEVITAPPLCARSFVL